jgi:hypothetical protein
VAELVHPEVEIHTERRALRGRAAAVEWSSKAFDHVERRYEPIEIEPGPGGVAVRATLQYVWTDSGVVGDEAEVLIELGIRDGLISSWRLFEDPDDVPEAPENR